MGVLYDTFDLPTPQEITEREKIQTPEDTIKKESGQKERCYVEECTDTDSWFEHGSTADKYEC